jgi:hypothetical protein
MLGPSWLTIQIAFAPLAPATGQRSMSRAVGISPTRFSLTGADPAAEPQRRSQCAAPPSEKRCTLSDLAHGRVCRLAISLCGTRHRFEITRRSTLQMRRLPLPAVGATRPSAWHPHIAVTRSRHISPRCPYVLAAVPIPMARLPYQRLRRDRRSGHVLGRHGWDRRRICVGCTKRHSRYRQ